MIDLSPETYFDLFLHSCSLFSNAAPCHVKMDESISKHNVLISFHSEILNEISYFIPENLFANRIPSKSGSIISPL